MTKPNVSLNPSAYLKLLWEDVDEQVAILRSSLRTLDDGNFVEHYERKVPQVHLHLELGNLRDTEKIKRTILRRGFCSIIGCLVDFIDRLIATSKAVTRGVYVTRSLSNEQEILDYISEVMENEIQAVAQDKGLNKFKKLSYFKGISEFSFQALEGYFSLRNSIEHHKSIAGRDIQFITRTFKLFVDDEEITNLPFRFEKGQVFSGKVGEEKRLINKGDEINFTEQELNNLALVIKNIIAPELQEAIKKSANS